MNSNPHHHFHLQQHQHQQHLNHPLSPYPTPPPSTESNCGGSRVSGNGMSYLDDSSGLAASPMQHNTEHPLPHIQHGPVPPSGWAKQTHHQQVHHHLNSNNSGIGNCSPNHGASSHNYLQQSFYPTDPHRATTESGSSLVRPSSNYSPVTNTPSPCAYYPPDPRAPPEYYHHQHQAPHVQQPHPQFNSFEHGGGAKNSRSRSCGGSSDEPMNFYNSGGSNSNFYHNHNHHQYAEFPVPEYSRLMNYNSGGVSGTGTGTEGGSTSAVGDYFTGPSSASRSSSICPSYGHHHVSTPLEFHQHSTASHQHQQPHQHPPHHQSQVFRRNTIETFAGDSDSGLGYRSGHVVKRESVIAPPWVNDPVAQGQGQPQDDGQYFYGSVSYRQGQSPQSAMTSSHRCESAPSHGTLTPPIQPSCAFDEGQYKRVGVKQRSHSLSYSRNYETHFRGGGGVASYHRHHHSAPGLVVDPIKDPSVPVSSSPDLRGQGQGFENVAVESSATDPTEAIIDEREDDAGIDDSDGSEESGSSGSSSSSPAGSRADSNESDDLEEDNVSDLDLDRDEELKEIQSVTTTERTEDEGNCDNEQMASVSDPQCDRDLPSCQSQGQQPSSNDPNKLFIEETELSNGSLTLFDSIALNTFDSPGDGDLGLRRGSDPSAPTVDNQLTPECSPVEGQRVPDGGDLEDQDSLSGLSSISSHDNMTRRNARPHSNCSASVTVISGQRSRSSSPMTLPKVMKRSFSETDKELVVNTTITALTTSSPSNSSREIKVPKGWRREIVQSEHNSSGFVFYLSPSDTKLRTMDEVKNYITSDGTCKCGLGCPLRLENAFSFDPKVRSGRSEEEGIEDSGNKLDRRSCCSHQHKRKIPLSEDSPLISSTRDDLGDSGDGEEQRPSDNGPGITNIGAKKRRTEIPSLVPGTPKIEIPASSSSKSNLIVIPSSTSTTAAVTPTTPLNIYNQNVMSIPFAQQSPDTTTQTTPQRDMSPASSVSSETSSSLAVGSRSTNSTPTPSSSGIKTSPTVCTVTVGGKEAEFAWPVPPGTASLVRPQTPPGSWSPVHKKPNIYQHHLVSKSPLKRAASPCPNIDVRQIPLEQNQPPPSIRQGQGQGSNLITPGASHPLQGQNSSVSLVPISSLGLTPPPPPLPLQPGYSISPIGPPGNTGKAGSTLGNIGSMSNIGSIPNIGSTSNVGSIFTSILPPTASYGSELGMPRLINSTTPILSTGIDSSQLPNSITISVIGSGSGSAETASRQAENLSNLPKLVQKNPSSSRTPTATTTQCNPSAAKVMDSAVNSAVKSPLQCVQDVVDRFHSDGSEIGAETMGSGAPVEVIETPVIKNRNPAKIDSSDSSASASEETLTLESKILKIIADAASASASASGGKVPENFPKSNEKRYGNLLPASPASVSVSCPAPLISSHQIHSLPHTVFTSTATLTTSTNSNPPIMAPNLLSCNPSASNGAGINQLILHQQPDPNNPSLRYPIFQTLQPIFLNPNGGNGPLLIPNGNEPQSFIQIDQNNQGHEVNSQFGGTTMVIDPSSMGMCGSNLMGPGPKKKKKRLSKKQQQQQAQLQLQQQLLLQQLFNHQQTVQQQHVQQQQQIPLLLPPSFNLGPQGFLQPMNMNMNMNFFPTPTILTLPNLILNPADGTLFIQQAGPQQQTVLQQQGATAQPGTATALPPQLKLPTMQVTATNQQSNIVLPRKDILTLATPCSMAGSSNTVCTVGEAGKSSGELGIDDSSRQNATPDSSTNDCQLGTATVVAPPQATTPITVSLPLGSSTNLQGSKKGPIKSKVVSSSTATTVHKRILPQKQILPKIDSTTPSVENNN